MARKTVLDLSADTTVAFEKVGQSVNGYYIGSKAVKANFGMTNLHILQTESGPLGVWGSAQLDGKLATVTKGNRVWITYTNKVKVPKGQMKTFTVEYDDEDTMEVSGAIVNFSNSKEPESYEDNNEDDSTTSYADSDDSSQQDVDPEEPSIDEDEEETNPITKRPSRGAAPTSTSQQEQKRKAEAMLNKRRSLNA